MLLLLNLYLLLFTSWGSTTPSDFIETRNVKSDTEYLLPVGAIEVQQYQIKLTLADNVFETNSFTGEAQISFKNLKTTKEIVIHSNGIVYDTVELVDQDGNIIILTKDEYKSDELTDFLIIESRDDLAIEHFYQLKFKYTGRLITDQMYGLYRSSYTRSDGTVQYLATTQFQPTHARKVFPCFDEPSYKAEFDITVNHPAGYFAIGNAAGTTTDNANGSKKTVFETTPQMPTYLIALVVSDFDCTNAQNIEADIPHFICSRAETKPIRELAVEYATNLTWALEDFTGIKFSASKLTKIHQFAIPDFAAGAMENWGLITYREPYLLWDPEESSNRYKQLVLSIIAHELAHYWFGNLVTTHWWSDTFLNEGFATYFEYHTTHDVAPELETDKLFVLEALQPVLLADSSSFSAALSSPAYTPAQVSGRFSSISYSKGGSIFRMVEHLMGLENFKKGLNQYLSGHQFGNTKPEDLWNALNDFTPALPGTHTLNEVMKNWVEQPGYPVINVTQSDKNAKITQARYLSSGELPAGQWYVPLTYTTSSQSNKFQETRPKTWCRPIGTLTIPNVFQKVDDWVIFNNQQTGYYRVDYEEQLWTKIKQALLKPGFDGIHELNRGQLIDDYFNFARFGHKKFAQLLDLMNFLEGDTSYYSWYPALGAFSYMVARTSDTKLTEFLSNHILNLSKVIYNSVPFNLVKNDDHIYTLKKVLVIPWACRLGLQNCIDNAVSAFVNYKNTQKKPDKNLRSVIYCNGLRHSTNIEEDWEFLWNEFLKTNLASEGVTILSTLGCAKDVATLNKYLGKSIDGTIRKQDALSVFSAVYSGNPEGVDVALEFLTKNFNAIADYYASWNSLQSLFTGLTNRFTKQDQINKFKQFIADNDLGEAKTSAETGLATAENNLKWNANFENDLREYFEPKKEENSSAVIATISISIYTVLLGFLF